MTPDSPASGDGQAPVLAVAGENVVDLVPAGGGLLRPVPGGGPANTAVSSARLGAPTMFLARFGTDAFAPQLRNRLAGEGVDVSRCPSDARASALALAGIDAHGSARYDFWLDSAPDWRWSGAELTDVLPDSVRALHLGSISALRPPGDAALFELARCERHRRTITFDPNIRWAAVPDQDAARGRVEDFCRLSHLVKASDDDLSELYPGVPADASARRLLGLGPRAVVVTRGGAGSSVFTRGGRADVITPEVEVRDTIGAGDAFMGALLAGIAADGAVPADTVRLSALLDLAAAAAALTCSRPGADPPTRERLCDFSGVSADLLGSR